MTREQSELCAVAERPKRDRKLEHEFRATRPVKDLPCLMPGCAKKFRPSTEYKDFLVHMRAAHGLRE